MSSSAACALRVGDHHCVSSCLPPSPLQLLCQQHHPLPRDCWMVSASVECRKGWCLYVLGHSVLASVHCTRKCTLQQCSVTKLHRQHVPCAWREQQLRTHMCKLLLMHSEKIAVTISASAHGLRRNEGLLRCYQSFKWYSFKTHWMLSEMFNFAHTYIDVTSTWA